MLNFRYHIVSLIAVFIALAVGVVLGAGPLQARISSSLSQSQAEESAIDATALADAQRIADADAQALAALAQSHLKGVLAELKVAMIALPGASAEDIAAVSDGLEYAGAEIVGQVSLSENWQAQSMATYRDTLATPLAAHLPNVPTDATSGATIAYGIVAALTSTGAETELVTQILTDDSTPILHLDNDPKGRAQALVVVGARDSAQGGAQTQSAAAPLASEEAWSGLARALSAAPKSGLMIVDAHDLTSMGAVLRSTGAQITTIDTPGAAFSVYAAAIALRDASASARAFGVEKGATQVMPELP